MSRLETGVVRIGNDWPGVFIRGDQAIHFAMTLRGVLDEQDPIIRKAVLKGLADLLDSCDVAQGNVPTVLEVK